MFKKITAVAALSTTLLFGGTLASAGASANADQANTQPETTYTTYYTMNGGWNLDSDNRFDNLLNNYFNNINTNQEKSNDKQTDNSPSQNTNSNNQDNVNHKQPEQSEQTTQTQQPERTEKQANQSSQASLPELSQYEQQVVDLTNQKRQEHGLSSLKADKELSRVAREKSNDMNSSHYFDHNSPTYGSPFDMMKSYGISYKTAGENIAKGQATPEAVVNAWMNSEGHRANILNEDFTHIGVGYVEQGNHWTQQFIGK